MDKTVWLVFKWSETATEFQGVFDSKEKAVAACRDWQYCVCPAMLNESLPDERASWPGAFYPKARAAE